MANITGTALNTVRNLRNYLRNGSFYATPTVETTIHVESPEITTPGLQTMGLGMNTLSVADPGIVYRPAADPYLAYWTITGDGTYFDVNPLISGKRFVSPDGGNFLRCGFSDDATAMLVQSLPGALYAFRGQFVTAALTVQALSGTARVRLSADFGTGAASSVVVSSANATKSRRVGFVAEVPVNATKVDITITIAGERGASIGVSGAMLALGSYQTDVPYSDNPLDNILPPGCTIMFVGAACPPGFRRVGDATDAIPYLVPGTPGQMFPLPRTEADVLEGAGITEVAIYDEATFAVGTDTHVHKIDGAFDGSSYWDWTEYRNQATHQNDPDTGEEVRTGTTEAGVDTPRINPEPFVALYGETKPPPASPRSDWTEVLTSGHKHNLTLGGSSVPPYFTVLLCERI